MKKSKSGQQPAKSLRKPVPAPKAAAAAREAPAVLKKLRGMTGKDAPAAFIQKRLGTKVKDLRCTAGGVLQATVAGESGPSDLESLREGAARRGSDFDRQGSSAAADVDDSFIASVSLNPNREAENTRRRFYQELRKVVAAADIVIEVLDARDPASCRNQELERHVLNEGKKLVLLLNKIDLVPKHAMEAWKKHLQRSFPTIAFKAARSGAQRPVHANTSAEKAPEGLLRSTHGVVGADDLMQLLKNYSRVGGSQTKAHVSVGVVGYPNTGKSSVINSMKRHNSVQVGGQAGVTKVMQQVPLDSKVTLIDSPGVVFAGNSDDPNVVLRNVVKVENVADPVGVVEALIAKTPRDALRQFYDVPESVTSPQEFLFHIARTRGKLVRGGGLDVPSAARSIITDWTVGRFRYFVMPPETAEASTAALQESAEVVSSLAPALDIDALMAGGGETEKAPVLGVPAACSAGGAGDDQMAVEGSEAAGGTVQVDM